MNKSQISNNPCYILLCTLVICVQDFPENTIFMIFHGLFTVYSLAMVLVCKFGTCAVWALVTGAHLWQPLLAESTSESEIGPAAWPASFKYKSPTWSSSLACVHCLPRIRIRACSPGQKNEGSQSANQGN
jgi:hypothetical protein